VSDELGSYARVTLQPGETIISLSSGGGGYGPPSERDPKRVEKDLREGWITRERAERLYGVVLDDRGFVDEAGTVARRNSLQEGGS
jgi:N-methylhydantoinase B